MEANNEGINVRVHFDLRGRHDQNEVSAHWRLSQGQILLTMVRAYDIDDATVDAIATIFLFSTHVNGISRQLLTAYIRRRLGEEIRAADNDENVENFAQVDPDFLEFTMPAPEVLVALEWQEQD